MATKEPEVEYQKLWYLVRPPLGIMWENKVACSVSESLERLKGVTSKNELKAGQKHYQQCLCAGILFYQSFLACVCP